MWSPSETEHEQCGDKSQVSITKRLSTLSTLSDASMPNCVTSATLEILSLFLRGAPRPPRSAPWWIGSRQNTTLMCSPGRGSHSDEAETTADQ